LEVVEKALEVLEKPLKNLMGKFTQAILGAESKQSFIRSSQETKQVTKCLSLQL